MFAEVAQEVLEYLGVPHDEPIETPKAAKAPMEYAREDDGSSAEDVSQLYAAVNDLPKDDPLRSQAAQADQQPAKAVAAGPAQQAAAATVPSPDTHTAAASEPAAQTAASPAVMRQVVMQTGKQVKVPSFAGMSIRQVIEAAAAAGLEVEVAGSGTVREQAPAPGTLVAAGTHVVVHGTR